MEGRLALMNPVFIAQTAAITPLGPDLDSLFQGLLDKKTAIKPVNRFKTDNYLSSYAAIIESLSGVDQRSMVFELADKLISQLSNIPEDTILFTASTKSGIDLLEKTNQGINIDKRQLIISTMSEYISQKLNLKDKIEKQLNMIMTSNFAFGGINATLILKKQAE